MAPPDPWSPPPPDRKAAIRELIRGREVAIRLGDLVRRSSAGEGGRDEAGELAEQVLTSLSKALQALDSGEFSEVCQGPAAGATSLCSDEGRSVASSGKRKARLLADRRGGQRRRSHSYQLTVRSKTTEDGHTWRKYGQKGIQSAAHPRSYFRCTHKNDQGCQAIRQVQKCEDDPSIFVITYMGQHTCTKAAKSGQPGGAGRDAGESYLISFDAGGPALVGSGGSIGQELQVPAAFVNLQGSNQEFHVDDDALSNLSRNDSSSEFFMLPELETLGNPVLPPATSDMIGDSTSGLHSSCVSPSSGLAVDSFPLEDMFNLDHDELGFIDFADCAG
ncbi:hypothetical protein Taro_037921 [Colocasia esculenta]|uniref:WRKY domain-containing protein n=1 Tax=Colocasia esculenta TaxID=4460 RepID=A0A843WM44_COLES|nr:hypothetical protein [Colocasia esculenta]